MRGGRSLLLAEGGFGFHEGSTPGGAGGDEGENVAGAAQQVNDGVQNSSWELSPALGSGHRQEHGHCGGIHGCDAPHGLSSCNKNYVRSTKWLIKKERTQWMNRVAK